MRLLTEIEPGPAPLPDHIEIGVRIAGMKMEDARRMQNAAALNSEAVRIMSGHEQPKAPLHNFRPTFLSATEKHAAEQYAYARFLMGVDNYWETLPHFTTKQRYDYILEKELQ